MTTTLAHPIDAYDTADLQREVTEVNEVNGWFDTDRTLLEGVALLASEVAEALEAFRDWKLEDVTERECKVIGNDALGNHHPDPHLCKPEGVGSELADVLVRLLDETHRQGWELVRAETVKVRDEWSFGSCLGQLTIDVARLGLSTVPGEYAAAIVFGRLVAICDRFGIDLMAEYTRKIAYNRTRSYRHGNRAL